MTTDQSQPENSAPALPEIPNWLCLCLLAASALVMLGKVLFVSPHEVLSNGRMDLATEYVHWRYFGFHELKSGNLALWNPHCYCGAPFFGSFQSALLYPLNFLYLLTPLDAATNWTIALHVFLGGVFTFYWVRRRGLHSLACLLSGMMFMFCGPHFLQIQAGHLSNLCTLIWTPLLFLAIDQLTDRPALAPCLMGMFAVAMSVLAGHPQYVFYMGVAVGIYAVLNVVRAAGQRGKVMLGLAGIVVGGICLSAVQLFTGLDEGRESMRSLGMSYESASSFSFPPENFLTLVAPWCFGDAKNIAYMGRWFVTDVSLFVSVMGLVLAVYGMARGAPAARRFSIIMLIITLVLAMGGYTPVFHFLYDYVPGFNLFRGMDKFLWLAALFLSMLAGVGLDQMLRGRKVSWCLIGGVAGAGIAVCGLSILPRQLDWWTDVLMQFRPSTMPLMPVAAYIGPNIIERSSAQCSQSLIEGGVCLLIAAGLLILAKSRRWIACVGMLLMAVIELASFAQTSLMTFPISAADSPGLVKILANHPGDYRIKCENPNRAMTTGALDIEGGDPSGLLRYKRYLDFTEGFDYDTSPYDTRPKKYDTRAWRMLRCRYVISESRRTYEPLEGALPRLLLMDRFRVMTNYHKIFSTLTNASFHVDEEIILESQPAPAPQPAREKGTVRILKSSTDYVTIEADAKAPCLLLMTDAYSSGWRALALPGSSQARYQIMPANYCLRAIPLAAGHHLLRMEYSPPGFRIGKVVSIAAWPIFIAFAGLAMGKIYFGFFTRAVESNPIV
jgi:branched-subunit amino acid transport protein